MLKKPTSNSQVNLGTMFASAQAEKNNSEVAEIERQLEELTFGSKASPAPAPYASPGLAHFFPSSSSSSSSTTTTTSSSSSAAIQNNQKTKNFKEMAKLHTKMLRNEKARHLSSPYPGYMEEMYPEAYKLQKNRNKRTLAKLAPYMNANAKEEFKNNIQAALNFVSAENAKVRAEEEAAKKAQQTRLRYNPYGTVRYNGTPRFYRKTRKNRRNRKTRKNRK